MVLIVSGYTRPGHDSAVPTGLVRLFNPTTQRFLHLSGTGEVRGTTWAWLGTRNQARRLAAGQVDWPYKITSREDLSADQRSTVEAAS